MTQTENVEREALTVGQLIKELQKYPQFYTVHANILAKVVVGIDGVIDIGGDYFSQIFLENFDHDPECNVEWKTGEATQAQPPLSEDCIAQQNLTASRPLEPEEVRCLGIGDLRKGDRRNKPGSVVEICPKLFKKLARGFEQRKSDRRNKE